MAFFTVGSGLQYLVQPQAAEPPADLLQDQLPAEHDQLRS